MIDFLWNAYVWMNVAGLVCVFIDKCAEGDLEWLFGLGGIIGPFGATIGCFLFRHHTSSGGCAFPLIIAAVHYGIYALFTKIF